MSNADRRTPGPDRRRTPRGGRRASDRPGRFPKVLVADSYEGARIPCVKYLDRLGFSVDQAVTGPEVLAKIIAGGPPHVILIERGLPSATISEIVTELSKGARSVPVIVMASDLVSAAEQEPASHHVTVLQKPFELSAMLEEIRRLLRLPLYNDGAVLTSP